MTIYSKVDKYDIIILSIIGGFTHIIGQFIALILLLNNLHILYMLPIYLLIGIGTGFFIGVLSKLILNSIKDIL